MLQETTSPGLIDEVEEVKDPIQTPEKAEDN